MAAKQLLASLQTLAASFAVGAGMWTLSVTGHACAMPAARVSTGRLPGQIGGIALIVMNDKNRHL